MSGLHKAFAIALHEQKLLPADLQYHLKFQKPQNKLEDDRKRKKFQGKGRREDESSGERPQKCNKRDNGDRHSQNEKNSTSNGNKSKGGTSFKFAFSL